MDITVILIALSACLWLLGGHLTYWAVAAERGLYGPLVWSVCMMTWCLVVLIVIFERKRRDDVVQWRGDD